MELPNSKYIIGLIQQVGGWILLIVLSWGFFLFIKRWMRSD